MPIRVSRLRPRNDLLPYFSQQKYRMPVDFIRKQGRPYSQSSRSLFYYRLGASASGKSAPLRKPEHGYNYWTQQVIEREPSFFSSVERYSGEDAFFVSQIARSDRHVVLGIADGVGGWQDQGINPAKFSHGLCRYMAEATFRPEKEQDLRPVSLLQKAYDQVLEDKTIIAGGSTACVASLEHNGQMEVGNLGDSGFVILQPGKVAYGSKPQTHEFNTPYQLSKLTPKMQSQRAIFGGAAQIAESPSAADNSHHTLRHGDVAVFATDGCWDNLSSMEVLDVISAVMQEEGHWTGGSKSTFGTAKESLVNRDSLRSSLAESQSSHKDLPGKLAYAVMRAAKIASHDTRRDGPFAKEVHKYFPGERYHGGKVDDICVLVCIAVEDGEAEMRPKAKL